MTTKPLKFKSAFVIPELGPPIIQDGFLIHCAHRAMVPMDFLREHLDPKNRNSHPSDQVDELVEQYKFQGIRHPIIVSTLSGIVKAGDGRFQAAERAGMTAFPVDFQPWDNEDQEYAFGIADNAIQAWSVLDLAGINLDLSSLDGMTLDIDRLAIRGFEIEMADKAGEGDPDEVPEPAKPIVQPGELYLLGDHRLLCGDCTDLLLVDRLMNGEKADMVFTDPPYNHGSEDALIASTVSQSMRKLKAAKWDKSFDIGATLASIDAVKAENSTVYICTSHHLAGKIFDWQAAATQGSYCVWVKPNPMPSLMKRHWTWDHELVCYSTYGKHTFNFPESGHAPASWTFNKNQKNDLHPTQKPVEVPEHAIKHSSKLGAIVWDGFLGSGSTLIACEKNNRKCYGMEIDPIYCGVILDRWAKFTGLDPHREDGIAWSDIKANLVS